MQGITSLIDVTAMMAIINHKTEEKYENIQGRAGLDLLDAKDGDSRADHICKPCKLNGCSKRRMHTIIAGSIRPPHRLKHTGRIQSDECQHPQRKGKRCDTVHIFWECLNFEHIRKRYLDHIEHIINESQNQVRCACQKDERAARDKLPTSMWYLPR